MFISPAFAQSAPTGGGADMFLINILPIVLIFAIIYFLMIRPQQQRMKAHQLMVSNVKRGDVVVTSGGIIGKVVKVLEGDEVLVEVAEDVRIRVVKSTIADVRTKGEPSEAKSKSDETDKK